MRRKSREINIFSMSALDLFASALGAFIMITVVLFPFFLKEEEHPPCPPVVDPVCPPGCPPCVPVPPQAKDNFLIVSALWDQIGDVDLYVRTPRHVYGPSDTMRSFRDDPGSEIVKDERLGGRNVLELWKSFNPAPGAYEVCVQYFFSRRRDSNRGAPERMEIEMRLEKPTGPLIERLVLARGENQGVFRFNLNSEFEFEPLAPAGGPCSIPSVPSEISS